MEQDFYKEKLIMSGIEVVVPCDEERQLINRVIFDELCLGIITEESKRAFLAVIDHLTAQGAQGVILGCTEIGLLISQQDTKTRLFDTTLIHAEKAALYALGV